MKGYISLVIGLHLNLKLNLKFKFKLDLNRFKKVNSL